MLTRSNFFTHQQPHARTMLVLAVLLTLVASVFPTRGHAQSGWAPINGTITVINNSHGDQVDPHISGNLVTYSSIVLGNSYVRYYNFLTGTDASIPQEGVSLDYLSDVNDSTIAYTQITSNSYAVNVFDTSAGGTPITLDPQPNSQREMPSIGGQTVAWVDFRLQENSFISDIIVYDLVTGVKTHLTDDEFYDSDPSVSSDGSFIVWTKCQTFASGGSVDKFRIKIWNQASGDVVYDNQIRADETADPSTAIDGGSIVIH